MNYKAAVTQLYFLLIHTDGKVNQGEIALGKKMIEAESISEPEFTSKLELFRGMDAATVYKQCIANLRTLQTKQQIRCIAWLCVMANADGFMDKSEWQFIYKIYHKELHLPLDDIMEVQKELNMLTRNGLRSTTSVTDSSTPRVANF
jgi:uncharacterized tellurite resistance protein B-like protein